MIPASSCNLFATVFSTITCDFGAVLGTALEANPSVTTFLRDALNVFTAAERFSTNVV